MLTIIFPFILSSQHLNRSNIKPIKQSYKDKADKNTNTSTT